METFKVTRADDCIWVEDTRDGLVRHLVSEQAEELADKLQAVAKGE